MPASTRRRLRWIATALVAVCLGLGALATAFPLLVKQQGMSLVTLTGGSMMPAYEVGQTLKIQLRGTSSDTIGTGSVITFLDVNRNLVTHRVIEEVRLGEDPTPYFRTQGDANNAADPDLVPLPNVVGVVAGQLEGWEQVALRLQEPTVRLFVFGVPLMVVAIQQTLLVVAAIRRAVADRRVDVEAESVTQSELELAR